MFGKANFTSEQVSGSGDRIQTVAMEVPSLRVQRPCSQRQPPPAAGSVITPRLMPRTQPVLAHPQVLSRGLQRPRPDPRPVCAGTALLSSPAPWEGLWFLPCQATPLCPSVCMQDSLPILGEFLLGPRTCSQVPSALSEVTIPGPAGSALRGGELCSWALAPAWGPEPGSQAGPFG